MTLAETIAELRELERKATPGPWWLDDQAGTWRSGSVPDTPACFVAEVDASPADEALMLTMRNHLAELLSALDSMQRRLEHAERAAILLRELAHEIESGGANLFATKATEAAYDEWLAADRALTSERKGGG